MLLVQSKGAANTGASGTVAFTSNVTVGNLLLIMYTGFNFVMNAPTDSLSNTWINLAPLTSGPGPTRNVVYAAVANSSGTCTVSYSGCPAANEAVFFLEEWSGVKGLAFAGFASQSGATSVLSNNVSPYTDQSGTAILFGSQLTNTNPLSVSPGTNRQTVSLSAGGYGTLADTPVAIQSSFNGFSVTWSATGASTGASVMLFLFPALPSTASNSGFAS
jgi:hypothetical protein